MLVLPTLKRFKKGYTLLELLVAIGLIGILSLVGIASYKRFNERQVVSRAAEEIRSYLRLAADKAANNEKDCRLCGGSDNDCQTFISGEDKVLAGWYVDLASLEIYGRCGEGGDQVEFGRQSIQTTGVDVAWEGANPIQFFPLNGGTNLTDPLLITIGHSSSFSFTLVVDPSGQISEQE